MSKNDTKCNIFYDQAVTLCTAAVAADDAGIREKAVAHYVQSCDYFVAGYRIDTNPQRRTLILSRIHTFIGRAEALKTSLRSSSAPQQTNTDNKKSSKRPRSATHPDTPTTAFTDVVGLHAAKNALINSVLLPQKQPQLFTGGRKPFSGILLYGPPGTGKTLLVQALANESNNHFISISASTIVSKYQGESERAIRDIFNEARCKAPCIIFIDEVDSLGRIRNADEKASTRRIKTELLTQMDGLARVATRVWSSLVRPTRRGSWIRHCGVVFKNEF